MYLPDVLNLHSVTDKISRMELLKEFKARRSKGIKNIVVRGRYEHKLTGVTITHKRTGDVHAVPDIDLRQNGIWSRMGWFKLPNDQDMYVLATVKHGEVYPHGGKYPSTPGIAMPGSAYYMTGTITRC